MLGINWRATTRGAVSGEQVLCIWLAGSARAFYGCDDEAAQGANWSKAGVYGAVFRLLFLFVPVRQYYRTTTAAALSARLLGTSQPYFG